MRPNRHQTWITVASVIAQRSTCLRRAVGCVLTNARGHVLATGYNGRASGLPHCNEWVPYPDPLPPNFVCSTPAHWPHACAGSWSPSGKNLDGCEAIHAEQNALLQCRDVHAIETCYVTVSPCVTCTKLLLNTSCREIVFLEPYAHEAPARELWEKAGRRWTRLPTLKNPEEVA